MSFNAFLLFMGGATGAAWIAWLVVLFSIDPVRAGATAFFFFFLTLGLALFGSLCLLGVTVRVRFNKEEIVSRHVLRSSRQALLFSFLLVGSLLLLAKDLLSFFTAILFVVLVSLIELAFMSVGHKRSRTQSDELDTNVAQNDS